MEVITAPGSWGSTRMSEESSDAWTIRVRTQRVTLYPQYIYVQHPQHCCHIMATDILESASLSTPQTVVEDISPLEQNLLDEYERLADNMKKVILRGASLHIPQLHNYLSLLQEIFPSGG
jgi:hypothetical protein